MIHVQAHGFHSAGKIEKVGQDVTHMYTPVAINKVIYFWNILELLFLWGGLKDHLGSEVVHIEAKLLDSELLRPKCLARCLLFSVGTRLKQH